LNHFAVDVRADQAQGPTQLDVLTGAHEIDTDHLGANRSVASSSRVRPRAWIVAALPHQRFGARQTAEARRVIRTIFVRVTNEASPSYAPVLATPITSTTFSIENVHPDFRVVSRSWWKLGGAESQAAWWGGSGGEVKVGG
jgi:hypothetical protein